MNSIFKYFKFEEMLKSDSAKRHGIDNTPTDAELIDNINFTLTQLDEIRAQFGKPIIITSGYRCPQLNTAVGGVKNSQHMKGQAADIIVRGGKAEMFRLFKLIHDRFIFDQLIWEHGGDWIHVSFRKDKNRGHSFEA